LNERLEAQRLTRLSYKQDGIGFIEAYKLEGVFMVFVILQAKRKLYFVKRNGRNTGIDTEPPGTLTFTS
jgi:hypothetical protein